MDIETQQQSVLRITKWFDNMEVVNDLPDGQIFKVTAPTTTELFKIAVGMIAQTAIYGKKTIYFNSHSIVRTNSGFFQLMGRLPNPAIKRDQGWRILISNFSMWIDEYNQEVMMFKFKLGQPVSKVI